MQWRNVSVFCEGRIQVRWAMCQYKKLTKKRRQLKIIKMARG
jgi:hypothetical protein